MKCDLMMSPMVYKSRKSLSVGKNSSLLEMRRDPWSQADVTVVGCLCRGFKLHHIPEDVPALPTPVIMKDFCQRWFGASRRATVADTSKIYMSSNVQT